MHERYFDNAATTPVDPRVVDEMLPYFTEFPGNAATIHHYGQKAKAAIDLARERVAALIQAEDPSQITFLSGSSEGNNWVLGNYKQGRVAISPYEHSSIIKIAKRDGFTVLPPFEECLPENFDIVALMSVNNEVGTIFDTELIRTRTISKNLLVDVTQSAGKLPTVAGNIDYISAKKRSISSHISSVADKKWVGGEVRRMFLASWLWAPLPRSRWTKWNRGWSTPRSSRPSSSRPSIKFPTAKSMAQEPSRPTFLMSASKVSRVRRYSSNSTRLDTVAVLARPAVAPARSHHLSC